MKVTLENFRKMQEYKKLGLSQKKTATNLSLTLTSVRKWWDANKEELLNTENTRAEYLDNYKEFMLSQLHTCPQIKVTNLFFKLKATSEKQRQRFKYFTQSSLIIIDDMMYAGIRDEDLVKFYHSIMLLNETRSIIFITNRERSSW